MNIMLANKVLISRPVFYNLKKKKEDGTQNAMNIFYFVQRD